VSTFGATACNGISNWNFVRRQVAHQSQNTQSAAKESTQVYDQTLTIGQIPNRVVIFMSDFDANYARSNRGFQIPYTAVDVGE